MLGDFFIDFLGDTVTTAGDEARPEWNIKWKKDGEWRHKSVKCPCSVDGQTLDSAAALKRILGQVAAIGIPKEVARKVLGIALT